MAIRAVGAMLLVVVSFSVPVVAQKDKAKGKEEFPVNDKVVAFAKKSIGEKVGNGECWTLANDALKSAGGKSSSAYRDTPNEGDYVWGELVYGREVKNGKPVESGNAKLKVVPGDIIQFRDAKFAGQRADGGTYSMTAVHHTAIVVNAAPDGKVIAILHQNWNGYKTVAEAILTLTDLQQGWVKVYRPAKE
jgi:hypothetical protein